MQDVLVLQGKPHLIDFLILKIKRPRSISMLRGQVERKNKALKEQVLFFAEFFIKIKKVEMKLRSVSFISVRGQHGVDYFDSAIQAICLCLLQLAGVGQLCQRWVNRTLSQDRDVILLGDRSNVALTE